MGRKANESNNVTLYLHETLTYILNSAMILHDMPFKKDMRIGQGPEKSSWHDQGDR